MVKLLHRTLLITALLFAGVVTASANTLTATVASNQVTKAEVFQLRLTYDDKVDSNRINFSVLESHFFLGQPSFGSSLNYVNGKRSSRSEWTIALKAKQLGTVTIPPFTIDGVSSQPITIQVSQDKDLPKPNDLVTIQSQLDKAVLYPNESTKLKTRLIIKSDPRRLQDVKLEPPFGQAFSVEQVGQPNQYQTVINGVEATVVDQTFNVTALNSGDQTLNSLSFSATFVFGSNRSGTTKLLPVQIAPEKIHVEVKPKPNSTDDAWLPTTSLSLKQRWLDDQGNVVPQEQQPLQLNVGDSITRQLTLTIQGITAEHFPEIMLSYPDAVRHYSEKPLFKNLDNGQTQMTIQQVLIAQQAGSFDLPPVTVGWFNTQTESKEISKVDGLQLDIAPTETATITPVTPTPTAQSTEIIKDAGYWPYLAGMFALLWLTTLFWMLKTRTSTQSSSVLSTKPKSDLQALIDIIKSQDNLKVQYTVKQWLLSQKGKSAELELQILSELNIMAAAQYSHHPQQWCNTTLLSLIKKLDNLHDKSQNNSNLSKL